MTAHTVLDVAGTAANLRRHMEDAGETPRSLMAVLGFTTPQAIYKWLRGENLPTIDNMVVVAAVLDVGLDDIVARKEAV